MLARWLGSLVSMEVNIIVNAHKGRLNLRCKRKVIRGLEDLLEIVN